MYISQFLHIQLLKKSIFALVLFAMNRAILFTHFLIIIDGSHTFEPFQFAFGTHMGSNQFQPIGTAFCTLIIFSKEKTIFDVETSVTAAIDGATSIIIDLGQSFLVFVDGFDGDGGNSTPSVLTLGAPRLKFQIRIENLNSFGYSLKFIFVLN